jgi:hypothetical protein
MARPTSCETVDMKTRLISLIFALGLGLVGDVFSATEYAYALASRGCMQNDASALEIYLTQGPYSGEAAPPKPYLRVEIAWADWGKLVGKDLKLAQFSRRQLGEQTSIVHASLNLERRTPVWLQGTLRLKKIEVNNQVEGSYEFYGPDNLKWIGAFKAQWGKDRLPCG